MGMSKIASMWVYPWDLIDETPATVVARAQELGLNELSIAVIYHAARVLLPHNRRRRLWYAEPGAAYFHPDTQLAYGPLCPPVSGLVSRRDLLQEVISAARKAGLRIAFWVIGVNNAALGKANPTFTLKTAFGDQLLDYLCPSNEGTQRYLLALLTDLTNRYAPDAFYLESFSYMGWESPFQLDIANIPIGPLARFLLGLCFCPACLRQARKRKLEIYALHKWVRDTLTKAFEGELGPELEAEVMASLPEQVGGLAGAWFDMRRAVITGLYHEMAQTIGQKGPILRLELFAEPEDLWQQGIHVAELAPILSSAYLNCYAGSPDKVAARWQNYAAVIDQSWQRICGLRVGYSWLNSAEAVKNALAVLMKAGAAGVCFYNYGLMSERHLNWVSQALMASSLNSLS
jgi:hypothetical protein